MNNHLDQYDAKFGGNPNSQTVLNLLIWTLSVLALAVIAGCAIC